MKVPKPIQLPSGSWRVRIVINGQRISRTFFTKKEAVLWATNAKYEETGFDVYSETFTIEDAAKKYIKNSVLSPSTVAGYNRIVRNALASIGSIELHKLKQRDVDRWVRSLVNAGKSPKTIRNAHGFLSAVLREYRPGMKLNTHLPKGHREEISIPTMEELKKIVDAAKGTRYELPISLSIWLGLRASEILGLTWDSVKDGYLYITQARVMGDDGMTTKGTKTFAGKRKLPLNDYLLTLLQNQPQSGEYIVNMTGGALYKGFSRICEKANVPHYRFHDLRHVNASIMIGENVPQKYITSRMGHATPDMVNRVYGHTFEEKSRQFDAMIDSALEYLIKE